MAEMVSGYNQEIKHEGQVYHVQTEDKGRRNPVIETLIYVGGQIIHHERTRYDDIAAEGYTEAEVATRVEAQHRRMINTVLANQFAEETQRQAFGEKYVTRRPFDEVVLEYLEQLSKAQAVTLELVEHTIFQPSAPATVQVRARHRSTGQPLGAVRVRLRLICVDARAGRAAEAVTDDQGNAQLEFSVPEQPRGAVAVIETNSDLGCDELKLLLG